jgi:O-methyltransferase involved in polyketide biosynthesis
MLASDSLLILTYVDKRALDGSRTFRGSRRWKSWVRFSGEPFIFGFDPATLGEYLQPRGFLLRSDGSTADAARQYCASTGRSEIGSELYRVATMIRVRE